MLDLDTRGKVLLLLGVTASSLTLYGYRLDKHFDRRDQTMERHSAQKREASRNKALINAYTEDFDNLRKRMKTAQWIRVSWQDTMQSISNMPAVLRVTQSIESRQMFAALHGLDRDDQSASEQTLYRSEMTVVVEVQHEAALFEAVNRLASLTGIAINIYQCDITKERGDKAWQPDKLQNHQQVQHTNYQSARIATESDRPGRNSVGQKSAQLSDDLIGKLRLECDMGVFEINV